MKIIKSLLDTDLYKLSTSYFYMRKFPEAQGTFSFIDRDNTEYNEDFIFNFKLELQDLKNLKLSNDELEAVVKKVGRYIPRCYFEWMQSFYFDPNKIKIELDSNNHLKIEVTDYMYKVTLYEVPLLAMVSELRNKMLGYTVNMDEMFSRLDEKIELSNREKLYFSEFGCRRRFSYKIQDEVVKRLKEKATYCNGTSNVHLAIKYDMKAMGTYPHELVQFHSLYGYGQANYMAMENWSEIYQADLGIALTDTYTSELFFKNFSRKHAKLFDGIRHDSGDPYKFITKAVNRYKELGIDPQSKTIIFSNALTMPEYKDIADCCKGRIKCAAGIGTNLSNDTGNKPSNIVMKLTRCRMSEREIWHNVVKISDDEGKEAGSKEEVEFCKRYLNSLKDDK